MQAQPSSSSSSSLSWPLPPYSTPPPLYPSTTYAQYDDDTLDRYDVQRLFGDSEDVSLGETEKLPSLGDVHLDDFVTLSDRDPGDGVVGARGSGKKSGTRQSNGGPKRQKTTNPSPAPTTLTAKAKETGTAKNHPTRVTASASSAPTSSTNRITKFTMDRQILVSKEPVFFIHGVGFSVSTAPEILTRGEIRAILQKTLNSLFAKKGLFDAWSKDLEELENTVFKKTHGKQQYLFYEKVLGEWIQPDFYVKYVFDAHDYFIKSCIQKRLLEHQDDIQRHIDTTLIKTGKSKQEYLMRRGGGGGGASGGQ